MAEEQDPKLTSDVTLGEINRNVLEIKSEIKEFPKIYVSQAVYQSDKHGDELRFRTIEGEQKEIRRDLKKLAATVSGIAVLANVILDKVVK